MLGCADSKGYDGAEPLLAPAINHFPGDAAIVVGTLPIRPHARIAHQISLLDRVPPFRLLEYRLLRFVPLIVLSFALLPGCAAKGGKTFRLVPIPQASYVVTDGALLEGVRFRNEVITTETVVMRSITGTVRWISGEHREHGKFHLD